MFSVSARASFVLTVTSMIADQNLSKPLPAVSIPPGLFLQIRKQINLTVFGKAKSRKTSKWRNIIEFKEEASSENSNFFSFSTLKGPKL